MAVRVVYAMGDKEPDVIEGADGWHFTDGTLRIWRDKESLAVEGPMVEIREDYVLSVEQVASAAKSMDAPKSPVELSPAAETGLSDSQED